MITLLNMSFWLYFIFFFIAVFLAFFVPGDLILRKISLPSLQRIVLATIIGMVLWGWQGFIFGYLKQRWLSYPYLILAFIIWLIFFFREKQFKSFPKLKLYYLDWQLVLIIICGVILQLSAVWFNGILIAKGLFFCCGNVTDNILHIALTNQLVKNFPPYEPGMFDVVVKNYHYWGNLIIAELIRVFNLPLIATQFQYSTLFISLFLGLSAIVFGKILNLSRRFTVWLLFFLYFGGDLIFLLVSYMRREFNFNMSSLEDGAKFLVNPPRAFSIVIFFAGISLLLLWIKKKNLYTGILTALILGSLIGFKVYTGIFALSGLSLLIGYFLIRRNFGASMTLLIAFVLSLIIYLPVNVNAGGFYFTGFALFENFIVQPWMMLDRLELARIIYLEHGNWIRVIQQELIYVFIFIFTVFGTKMIGIFQTKKSLDSLPKELNIFLIGGIIVSAVVGFFFQQQSGGANTFNFLVSIFIIGSIYTALACDYWLKKIKNKIKLFLIILIVILTIPRVVNEEVMNMGNIQKREGFLIDNSELDVLNYLKEKTDKKSIILVDDRGLNPDARSLSISFLTDRSMFLSGKGLLDSHAQDTSFRDVIKKKIFESTNGIEIANDLLKNKINYIYLSYPYSLKATESAYFTKKIYQNGKITILKVSQDAISLYLEEKSKQL